MTDGPWREGAYDAKDGDLSGPTSPSTVRGISATWSANASRPGCWSSPICSSTFSNSPKGSCVQDLVGHREEHVIFLPNVVGVQRRHAAK